MTGEKNKDGATMECVEALFKENQKEKYLDAGKLLIKIATNILTYPQEAKYKNLRLANAIVDNKLLPVSGAMECLFEMGFVENGQFLTFPDYGDLEKLRNLCQQIKSKIENESNETSTKTRDEGSRVALAQGCTSSYSSNNDSNAQMSQNTVYRRLIHNMNFVNMYEDKELQQKALAVIPASEVISKAKDADDKLRKLLAWFRHKFFSWTDKAKCSACQNTATIAIGTDRANAQELQWLASTIELYRCNRCGATTRFPRYNHPQKLLETRTGRCGEFANCFTLMCRAVGFQARYILDFTDHVWTEVYSCIQNRWLHCDPCENVCDQPLLYEAGWKKQLSYVFAFSKDQVVDVTWRYSKDHDETAKHRKLCPELWLVNTLTALNKQLQSNMLPDDVDTLHVNFVREIVGFMNPHKDANAQLGGRTSGSLEWRLARSETQAEDRPYSFELSGSEKRLCKFHLRYCCSSDQYERVSDDNNVTEGFESCLFRNKAIFRKVENDWGMVYLARQPNERLGSICWSFNFKQSDLCIKNATIILNATTFNSGAVIANVNVNNQIVPLDTDKENKLVGEVAGAKEFKITATLSGGTGDTAWQHAQLFRQKLFDENCTFEVKIEFTKQQS